MYFFFKGELLFLSSDDGGRIGYSDGDLGSEEAGVTHREAASAPDTCHLFTNNSGQRSTQKLHLWMWQNISQLQRVTLPQNNKYKLVKVLSWSSAENDTVVLTTEMFGEKTRGEVPPPIPASPAYSPSSGLTASSVFPIHPFHYFTLINFLIIINYFYFINCT